VGDEVVEDKIDSPEDEDSLDDSDVSLQDVIADTHRKEGLGKQQGRVSTRSSGGLMSVANAEELDGLPEVLEVGVEVEEGRGKHMKKASQWYRDFLQHWDNKALDIE
jgi:hypothetical protein